MTHGRTELTIELRTADGRVTEAAPTDQPTAFATVYADRATFDGGQLVAWQAGAAIASYPVDSVAGLRFGSWQPTQQLEEAPGQLAAEPTIASTMPPTAVQPEAVSSASGVGWTPGEDALLRTLSDQNAGLTMMILKTQRSMDEVIARLTELGIAPTTR